MVSTELLMTVAVVTMVLAFGVLALADPVRRYRLRRLGFADGYTAGARQAADDVRVATWVHDTTVAERDAYRRIAASLGAHRRARVDSAFAEAERGYFDGLERAFAQKGAA